MDDIFTSGGLAAWQGHLTHSPDFADAAHGWSGTLLLREIAAAGDARRVWISLDNGELLDLRIGSEVDETTAEFVLAAEPQTWRGLVDGSRDLAKAAFTGELRLERGSVLRLLPHARAAAALLRAARSDPGD